MESKQMMQLVGYMGTIYWGLSSSEKLVNKILILESAAWIRAKSKSLCGLAKAANNNRRIQFTY